MYRIAIVEDSPEDRDNLRSILNRYEKECGVHFQLFEFGTADSFLLDYEPIYDVVFMDIEMPNLDGVTAAHMLRKIDPVVVLAFTTYMAQMAIRGYEVEALDFIVKPLAYETFALKMKRILQHVTAHTDEHICIIQEGVTYNVIVDDILYLEIDGHYIIYHTARTQYREYSSFGAAMKKIRTSHFVKCNRGTMVNLLHVRSVFQDSLVIEGNTIPISRSIRKEFMTKYVNFLGGKHA